MIRVVHPGSGSCFFYPSRIPDPGVKKVPDPGSRSRIRIRNTAYVFILWLIDTSTIVFKYFLQLAQ
jgi:hypothetical protein